MDVGIAGVYDTTPLPFVDLYVGETRIPLSGTFRDKDFGPNISPEANSFMLVDFNYSLGSDPGVGNNVSITILDPYWDALELMLVQAISQKQEFGFQYGWRDINGKVGRNIRGLFIQDFTISYSAFEGSKVSLIATDKTVALRQGRRNWSFPATQNIGSVIKDVIEKTDPSMVVEVAPISNAIGEEHRNSNNLTPFEYISELLKVAKSPQGASKFSWVVDLDEQGRTLIRIIADGPKVEVKRQYMMGRGIMGTMLSFNPQILGSVLLSLGGGRADSVVVNPETGGVSRVTSTADEVGPVHGDKLVHDTPTVPSAVHELPFDAAKAASYASDYRSRADTYMNNATAVVLGDPGLKPLDQVDVIVLKSGIPGSVAAASAKDITHTSGVYRVYSVEHTIAAGLFRTNLELYRESSFVGSKEVQERLPSALKADTDELSVEPEVIDPKEG